MFIELGLLIATSLVTVTVSLIILFAATVSMALRLSLILTLAGLAIWQNLVFISNNILPDSVFWNNFVFVWPGVAVASFFLFMHRLNEHRKWYKGTLRPVAYLAPIVLLGLGAVLQGASILSGQIFTEHGGTVVRGAAYVPYVIGLLGALIAVLGYTFISYQFSRRSKNERGAGAVRTVFYTVLFAVLYGLVTSVVIPLVTGTQRYSFLGIITVDIFAVGFMLSVVRGGLLDLKLYVVRTITYVLSLATLAVVYGILAFAVSRFFVLYVDSPVQIVTNVGLALVLAFIFQPIKRFFDRVTNKLFYRDEYTSEALFANLNRILGTTSSLHHLLEKVAAFVGDSMKASYAAFFIYQKGEDPIAAGTNGYRKLPLADAKQLDEYAKGHGYDLIVVDRVEDRHVRRLLMSHRIAIALPLEHKGSILGYFLLGEHRRNNYTYQDRRVLRAIDDELVIAVQNALSVQEIRDLNANLEQRIEAATRELRASNAQLHRLDEAKDEFISMASHQLRTPLTSIKGYISMLMEGDVGPVSNEQKHLLNEAFISSERMVRLIGDFLNVSRLQTGKFVIDRHPVDLARLVRDELDALEPSATARGLSFEYKSPKNLPKVSLDENKIQQVIMNFSDNAIYYSKDESVIKVRLRKVGNWVEFTVKDSGIGVPADQQSQLFNKFFRATNARQQRPDGTGVGLFLAKKVVDAHGGEIIFESKENKGSTFGFRLPID